ncbi:MAG: rhomboid family intramembrane serine protease [Chloroflexi bacterium]|nr:MAG: hypothetical protein CUN54_02295 [Phototrophicales bacterium]RMF80027.1 MAG: rhomboid family intramembrane serine protease [Chloroflexota bacterium]
MENEPSKPEKLHPLDPRARQQQIVAQQEKRQQQPQIRLHFRTVQPTVTHALIAINVAIFLLRALSPEIDRTILEFGINRPAAILRDNEYYRLLTSMFLHAGVFDIFGNYDFRGSFHIVFNMWMLYIFGRNLEALFGHKRFFIIYLLGGLGGSVLSAALNGIDEFGSIGASGAVFAIIGAEGVYLYHHRRLFGERGRARLRALMMWGAINFVFGFAASAGLGNIRIDNFGHLGGLIGGVVLTWFLAPIFVPRPDPDREGIYIAEDTNPYVGKYPILSAYSAALLAILFVAVLMVGHG